MKASRTCLVLAFTLILSTILGAAEPPGPRPSIGPVGPAVGGRGPVKKKPFTAWNEAELVFVGKLDAVVPGPVGRSYPPMYTHKLQFTVQQVLRGDLKAGDSITAHHVARQHNEPTFPKGEACLVAASKARGGMRVHAVEKASDAKVTAVQTAVSLPLGWKTVDGKPVSPWASLGEKAWPDHVKVAGALACSKSGRPALFVGAGIELTVEKVSPPKDIKWTNPDGDGEYKITVTNTTKAPVKVKALLTDGNGILWNESLVILCQGRAYTAPGAKGISGDVRPVQLEPGESVSTVVNALRLEGPEWPRGGYRIEFQFCLGEKSRTMSFYYMSRHHDKIRANLRTM